MRGNLLHVGCGNDPLPEWLREYTETRLDLNPATNPDIVGDMIHLGDIGPYDLIYSSHSLEHLNFSDVAIALEGFHRVLKPGGGLVVIVPDLEGIKADTRILYNSPAGPVAGLDMIFGMRSLSAIMPYMSHLSGFTQETLREVLTGAGFSTVEVQRKEVLFSLVGYARK